MFLLKSPTIEVELCSDLQWTAFNVQSVITTVGSVKENNFKQNSQSSNDDRFMKTHLHGSSYHDPSFNNTKNSI